MAQAVRILTHTVFHHDSPYDACSPRSNLTNNRAAPIRAFDASVDPVTNQLLNSHQRGGRTVEPASAQYRGHRAQASAPAEPYNHSAALASSTSIGLESHSEAANPNAEFFGVAAEPWQDFATPSHGDRRAYRDNETPSGRTSRSSTFADMETYLRGNTRPNPSVPPKENRATRFEDVVYKDEEPQEYTPRKSRGAPTQRSKSLIGRLRRLRVEPDEADRPDDELRRNSTVHGRSQARTQAAGLSSPSADLPPPVTNSTLPTTQQPELYQSSYAARSPVSPSETNGSVTPRMRRPVYAGSATTPYTADAADYEIPSRSRNRRNMMSPPALPPKADAYEDATPHTDYTEVVPDAEDGKPNLGRSKSFFARLASSSRARVI